MWKYKYRTALNWGGIKGVIATERKWMRPDRHKNTMNYMALKLWNLYAYMSMLSLCVSLQTGVAAAQ